MFDHQISRFEKRIADLPDQPTLAPDALKAWFDSAPEQLRQALNRVCADGKTLEERMESLVIGAYGGTVTREMLAQELQQEIAGKAEQSAVQASLSALSGSFTDSMQSTDGAFSQANLIYGGLATAASPAKTVEIAENGFNVLSSSSLYNGNNPMYTFKYIALR